MLRNPIHNPLSVSVCMVSISVWSLCNGIILAVDEAALDISMVLLDALTAWLACVPLRLSVCGLLVCGLSLNRKMSAQC